MLGYFLQDFGNRLGQRRDAERERARQADQQEYNLLSTLAQHGSKEVRAIAGTALLELASGGGKRKPMKGLKGFLGEVEQSPYLSTVQQALQGPGLGQQAAVAKPPATPGAGMLPSTAPVEPGAAPMSGPAVQASSMPKPQVQDPMFAPAPPPTTHTTGVQAPPMPLAAAPGPGMAPMIPPQTNARSLFPTAEEVAAETTRGQLEGRLGALTGALRGAQSPLEQELIMGAGGAPRRQVQQRPVLATIGGKEVPGSYDPSTGEVFVNGQVVQPESYRAMPTTVPREKPVIKQVDKNGNLHIIDPDTYETITTVEGVGKPQNPPPVYGGTERIVGPEGTTQVIRLDRDSPGTTVIGEAPTNAPTEEEVQYAAWLKRTDALIANKLKSKGPMGMGEATPRTKKMEDDAAKEITGDPSITYNDLQIRSKRRVGSKTGKSGLKPEEFKALLNELARMQAGGGAAAPTGQVQGSGVPTAPREPPK